MSNEEFISFDDLANRYYTADDGNRKPADYFRSYARLLEKRRLEHLRILEIGVASGASLLIWRDYLPNAAIVGLDIRDPPERILRQDRIHFIQGSQDDPEILDHAAEIAGGAFDLIVDDASHIGYLTKRSLHYLFPRWLTPGGFYVIEDFGTGFMSEYPDGQAFEPPDWNDAVPGMQEFLSSQYGMVGVVKQLIEPTMQYVMIKKRSYIAIERLIIEPNIVFIEKSMQPGGPIPGAMPGGPPHPSRFDTIKDDLQALTETVRYQADRLRHQDDRLSLVEQVLGRLLQPLAPLRRLRRSVSGFFRPD